MSEFLRDNIWTIVVALIVIAALFMAVISMIKRKRKGKSVTCGGNCSACSMSLLCKEKKKDD